MFFFFFSSIALPQIRIAQKCTDFLVKLRIHKEVSLLKTTLYNSVEVIFWVGNGRNRIFFSIVLCPRKKRMSPAQSFPERNQQSSVESKKCLCLVHIHNSSIWYRKKEKVTVFLNVFLALYHLVVIGWRLVTNKTKTQYKSGLAPPFQYLPEICLNFERAPPDRYCGLLLLQTSGLCQ